MWGIEMNPRLRTDWPKMFAELREWITEMPIIDPVGETALCDGCGSRLFLVRGRRTGKFFWSHEGLSGCEWPRAIFFDTKEQAIATEKVFL